MSERLVHTLVDQNPQSVRRQQGLARFLQREEGRFPLNGREALQECLEGVACFKVIEESSYKHARATKGRLPGHDRGIAYHNRFHILSFALMNGLRESTCPMIAALELTAALAAEPAGSALDLACGAGRHAVWLASRGWEVTAVDLVEHAGVPGFVRADLEQHEFSILPDTWDLIVCWLYWQADLLPAIAAGVRPGGIVALAGKTSGRFATSLANYRAAFPEFEEISAGEDSVLAFFIARRR